MLESTSMLSSLRGARERVLRDVASRHMSASIAEIGGDLGTPFSRAFLLPPTMPKAKITKEPEMPDATQVYEDESKGRHSHATFTYFKKMYEFQLRLNPRVTILQVNRTIAFHPGCPFTVRAFETFCRRHPQEIEEIEARVLGAARVRTLKARVPATKGQSAMVTTMQTDPEKPIIAADTKEKTSPSITGASRISRARNRVPIFIVDDDYIRYAAIILYACELGFSGYGQNVSDKVRAHWLAHTWKQMAIQCPSVGLDARGWEQAHRTQFQVDMDDQLDDMRASGISLFLSANK
ncbi:hypothetical protein BKA62DRAFT_699733 [Auriculariales sp. MPI-PUGE-AT-0066]|nr:hypothetical protein BKA62DRAFT_699733 [Auriculariales sp. MPI-PUGE-AT-0066]